MKHIEPTEIINSHRIPSTHGTGVEYEFLHAIVNWGANHDVPVECVLARMVYDGIPNHQMPAEIPLRDLEAFHREWNLFVSQSLAAWTSRQQP